MGGITKLFLNILFITEYSACQKYLNNFFLRRDIHNLIDVVTSSLKDYA